MSVRQGGKCWLGLRGSLSVKDVLEVFRILKSEFKSEWPREQKKMSPMAHECCPTLEAKAC